MSSRAHLDLLRQVPLFSSCSTRELQRIARVAEVADVDEGRVLVRQGTAGREAYVILEGSAEVRRNDTPVAQLGPGDHFGELALLDGGERTASVVATSAMRVLLLGQRELAGLLDTVPGLARKLLAALSGRIRELDSQIAP